MTTFSHSSNKDEMSEKPLSGNAYKRMIREKKLKAGTVSKDGIQTTLTTGVSPPDDSFLDSSNKDEMLKKSIYSQQELDDVEKHQKYQEEQKVLMQESAQILKTVIPDKAPENDDVVLYTKRCTTCGAIQQVPYNVDKCKFVSKSAKKHRLVTYEDESEIRTSKRYDVDSGDEITTFVNIEAEMELGTIDPEIEKINPYLKTWHYDFKNELVYDSKKQLYSHKARKTDIEREYELINDQICGLVNCLHSDNPKTVGYARKVIRLTQDIMNHDSDEKCDKCFEGIIPVPKIKSSKNMTKDEWNEIWYNKIIRQHGHYEVYDYPKECGHLSTKKLSDASWKYQQATRIKNPETGEMVDREDVDITAVKEVLAVLASHTEYPMLELVPNEIIMFGDSNQRTSWKDKGKRKVEVHGKVVPAWTHDKMRNQAFQQYNMDYMIEQSEHIDGSKMDNGVDGVFDGDIIYPTAGDSLQQFAKNKIAIVGASKGLALNEVAEMYALIESEILSYSKDDTVIISGGASGADYWAEYIAKQNGYDFELYAPQEKSKDFYLARNRAMARMSTRVVSIALPLREQRCYHCDKSGRDSNHERTGGCYTLKHASNGVVYVLGDDSPKTYDDSSSSNHKDVPSNVQLPSVFKVA